MDGQLVRPGQTWLFSGRSGMRRSEPGGVCGSMLAVPASPCGALWLPCVAESEKGDALGAPAAATEAYQHARIRRRASWALTAYQILILALASATKTRSKRPKAHGLQGRLWILSGIIASMEHSLLQTLQVLSPAPQCHTASVCT